MLKYGTAVLNAAPKVSVSKVDLLRLEDPMEVLAVVEAAERMEKKAFARATRTTPEWRRECRHKPMAINLWS